MGWQPDQDDAAGEESRRASDLPGGCGAPGASAGLSDLGGDARDPRLSGFARGGEWDICGPSAALAAALEGASGPEWRCPGATRDEMFGLLRQWQALESWAVAGKLGIARALIRDEGQPLPGGGYHGDLPDGWTKSLTHEVALALAMPPQSAETLMWTAWDLQARLPRTGALLADGALTYAKARAVVEALGVLTDVDAAQAEASMVADLPGKTYGQAERLAVQAAITVDPQSATRRREDAERNRARILLRRDPSGAASLGGYDLPTDETLAAYANVCARAAEYKDSGVFAGVRMDQFRAMAYLDILNGVSAEARIACGQPPAGLGAPNDYGPEGDTDVRGGSADPGTHNPSGDTGTNNQDSTADPSRHNPTADTDEDESDATGRDAADQTTPGPIPQQCLCVEALQNGGPGSLDNKDPDSDGPHGEGGGCGPGTGLEHEGPDGEGPESDRLSDKDLDGGAPDGDGPDCEGPESNGPGGDPGGEDPGGGGHGGAEFHGAPAPPRLADLIIPLATLLGLADHPGEGHGLGALDPDLCRALAVTAANSAHTTLCVTVTDPEGIAIGHGCARPARRNRTEPSRSGLRQAGPARHGPGHGPPGALAALPARVNLTVTAACLAELSASTEPGPVAPESAGPAAWSFARTGDLGPPGGFGTWALTLLDGRELVVHLEPVPAFDCDHRHQSHAYKPNDTLRHLVQIRDYECTFPTCSRHARESDFEHAVPYDQGGATCACNAGSRSRRCHQVKQSKGWKVSQPRPGWHQWRTPSGRTYTQGPKQYPV